MSTFNATDGRKNFFDLIDRAHHQERIAIERHGKLVAAMDKFKFFGLVNVMMMKFIAICESIVITQSSFRRVGNEWKYKDC
jgi:hypothetical protein